MKSFAQNMVEHLHALLFLFITPGNKITPDEIGAFVGTLIRMQWLRGLNLGGKCVIIVTIAPILSFTRFLGFRIHTAHTMRAIIRVYNYGRALFQNALSHTICVDVSVVSRLFSDTEVPGLSSNLRDHIPA